MLRALLGAKLSADGDGVRGGDDGACTGKDTCPEVSEALDASETVCCSSFDNVAPGVTGMRMSGRWAPSSIASCVEKILAGSNLAAGMAASFSGWMPVTLKALSIVVILNAAVRAS